MKMLRHGLVVLAAIGLQSCAAAQIAPPQALAAEQVSPARIGPALWKVADADTTIYLFGTVHVLSDDTQWLDDDIRNALASSQELVTEITPDQTTPDALKPLVVKYGLLPEGQTLRSLLGGERRAALEAALAKLGLKPNALDRMRPWLAAQSIGAFYTGKLGLSGDAGVEKVLEGLAGPDVARTGLETAEDQLAAFDSIPLADQLTMLDQAIAMEDGGAEMITKIIGYWRRGDALRLAEIMQAEIGSEAVAQKMLYDRNARWADWIAERLDRPGTVFMAVGAGHLGGEHSVQDYLAQDGIATTRLP